MMRELKSYEKVDSEKVLGKEKVSGYKCVKKEVTTTNSMLGMKTTETVILWQSERFTVPLRTKMKDGTIVELRNIKTGPPGRKVFQRPAGYRKANNMMEVMGFDFAAMDDERPVPEDGSRGAAPKGMEDVNVQEMMEQMQKVMGENMDPEQMEQMQQIMTHAMDRGRQTRVKQGAADGLWDIVPKRPGDRVGYEMKTANVYDVIMGSTASLQAVFAFYGSRLKEQGWQDGGQYIQNGQGTCSLTRKDLMLMISSADNPGMEGDFRVFYNLHLSGPDI